MSNTKDHPRATAPGFVFVPGNFTSGPGVYLMKDASGRIIYVGKAKNLRRRLASYFGTGSGHTPKTRVLVSRIDSVDTLSTATEKEALLLEDSLIKKHRPRFNILLRDDKSYILFRLDMASDYPRLTMTRRVVRDGSIYYGPFTSAAAARRTWLALGRVFALRKCGDASFRNRVRPCLYHHMGQCPAPCVKPVPRDEYMAVVRRVEMILGGRPGELVRALEKDMHACSEAMEFERAAELRDQIRAVRTTVQRQAAVLPGKGDLDVAALAGAGDGLGLCVLFVRRGRLLDRKIFHLPGLGLEDAAEAASRFLMQFYSATRFIPGRILLSRSVDDPLLAEVLAERRGGPVRLFAPRTGDEKRLVDMARANAAQAGAGDKAGIAELLGRALRLAGPPRRMEAVDASHLGGGGARVGMAVFEDGRPVRRENRAWTLPDDVAPGDDYAAMAVWAEKRVAQGPPWPDLILVDGGRGQLAAMERALAEARENVLEKIGADARAGSSVDDVSSGRAGGIEAPPVFALASIAKSRGELSGKNGPDRRAGALDDRIFLPGRKNHLPLRPGGPELLFLQRIRDAAHDLVIGRQRKARRKAALKSELLSLDGVGPGTARILWDAFGSIKAMAGADEAALSALPGIGKKKAARLKKSLAALVGGK